MNKSACVVIPGIECPRRSDRKTISFPIWLRNEDLGPVWEEETETEIVSRCGAGLRCRHLVSAETIVVIVRRDTGQRAKALVRYSRYNLNGNRELGIEFIDTDNFWDLNWTSSEPIDSEPQQIRTPSGVAQLSAALILAGIDKEELRPSKFELSTQLDSGHYKNKDLNLYLAQEEGFVFTGGW